MTVCTNRVRDYSLFVHRWAALWPLAELPLLCRRGWAQVTLLQWPRNQENWHCVTQVTSDRTYINPMVLVMISHYLIQNNSAIKAHWLITFCFWMSNNHLYLKLSIKPLTRLLFLFSFLYNFLSGSSLLCIHDTTAPQSLRLFVSCFFFVFGCVVIVACVCFVAVVPPHNSVC